MKKSNKILVRALVILLSLVLITSSVVSSTFAKYVVAKDAKATVGLQAFDLNVQLTVNGVAEPAKTTTGDSVSYTVFNLMLKPGDKYEDLFTASITGTPTVDANVTIEVDITDCSDEAFTIAAADFNSLTDWGQSESSRKYLPIGVYYGADYVVSPYTKCTKTVEATIEDAIGNKLDDHNKLTYSAGKATGKFDKNVEVTGLNNISIGFEWPESYTNVDKSDEIGTWIAKRDAAKFTVTYKITVVQDTTPTN